LKMATIPHMIFRLLISLVDERKERGAWTGEGVDRAI
jgi:hypothetical protein